MQRVNVGEPFTLASSTVARRLLVPCTVMVCWHEALLPVQSVAVQVMVVVPCGYGSVRGCPSLRDEVTEAEPQLSESVGDPGLAVVEACMARGACAGTDWLGGQAIAGGVLSTTVMTCGQVLEFPVQSAARQVRVKW